MSLTRAAIYLFHDRAGRIDEYVEIVLRSLRPFVSRLLLVSNGGLEAGARERLDGTVDEILIRDNVGFDVAGYRAGLEVLGWNALGDYDELILLNNTFFAPLNPWRPAFEAAAAHPEAGFWGLTDAPEIVPHPFAAKLSMPRHIQSHFIAVRRSLLTAPEFRSYWERMPPIRSYRDSIEYHESRFTEHFESLGHSSFTVHPASGFTSDNPSILEAEKLLDEGCPILKRRIFFHDPGYLRARGVQGPRLIAKAVALGYSEDVLLAGVARAAPPGVLLMNAGLVEVIEEAPRWPSAPMILSARIDSESSLPVLADLVRALPPQTGVILSCTAGLEPEVRGALPEGVRAPRVLIEPEETSGKLKRMLRIFAEEAQGAGGLYVDLGTVGDAGGDRILRIPGLLRGALELFRTRSSLGLVLIGAPEPAERWARIPGPEASAKLGRIAGEWGITTSDGGLLPPSRPDSPFIVRIGAIGPAVRTGAGRNPGLLDALGPGEEDLLLSSAIAESGFHTRYLLLPGGEDPQTLLDRWRTAAAESRSAGSGRSGGGAALRRFFTTMAPGLALRLVPLYRRIRGLRHH